jgi:SAM-dependent methyltransferase
MRARRLVPIVGLGLALAVATWRTIDRWHQSPYPLWMAVNPFTDWLAGTGVTLEQLRFQPGQQVLEIGPGLGRLLLPAAARVLPGGGVTGVEIDRGIAQALRERAIALGITNLTVIEGDAATQQLPAEHFDMAYLVAVLGEIGDRAAAIRRIHDALKPGGLLAIIEGWPDPHHQALAAVEQLVEPAGFEEVRFSRTWGRYMVQFTRR